MGVYLISVHLISMHLIGVYFISVDLIGVNLMGVYFTFPVRPSCFLCKALQMVTSIFLDSPLEIIVFSS